MITGTDRCCLLWDNPESFFPALAPFPWAVTARRSLIDSAIRICAFLKFQPIENLQPLMGALMPGGTLHYYNHESKEEFSTMDFSLVGWEGGTFLKDTALNFWSSKSLDMEFKTTTSKADWIHPHDYLTIRSCTEARSPVRCWRPSGPWLQGIRISRARCV